jgi:hypothetical protein
VGSVNLRILRKFSWFFSLLGGILLGLLGPLGPAAAAAEPIRCGGPGKPACPLQQHMRAHLATAFAHRDYRELARRFEQLVDMNPEPRKWLNWNDFARSGARAAREGKLRGVVAACARCHSIYRPEFNMKYRERPLASGTRR